MSDKPRQDELVTDPKDIQDLVQRHYRDAAMQMVPSCCGPGSAASACCTPTSAACNCSSDCGDTFFGIVNYSTGQTATLPPEIAGASLGCGNPIGLAAITPGDVVVDLGSGAGFDALLAADKTGPAGKVYGVDFTSEMVDAARANARRAGLTNVEFILASIDAMPLTDELADLVISNCVINLAANKDAVLREALRVLKPGGRLAVSDMVFLDQPPPAVRGDANLWAACIGGALTADEYRVKLTAAGFTDLSVVTGASLELAGLRIAKADIAAIRPSR